MTTNQSTLLHHSRSTLAMRRARVGLLQARRLLSWATTPERWHRPAMAPCRDGFAHEIYTRDLAITRLDAGADAALERGKLVNLAVAAPHFDGLILSPDTGLSFWRVLGRCTLTRGFRHGMELRGGCIVPTLGGGLCLLSNALFRLACELGWTIVERHGHTMEAVPCADAIWGLDATVFWPHVDLRVVPPSPVRLSVQVVGTSLRLRVHAHQPHTLDVVLASVGDITYERGDERWRANRVTRRIHDRAGELRASDVVADNRRRLLHSHEMRRNCLSCRQIACHARPAGLPPPELATGLADSLLPADRPVITAPRATSPCPTPQSTS